MIPLSEAELRAVFITEYTNNGTFNMNKIRYSERHGSFINPTTQIAWLSWQAAYNFACRQDDENQNKYRNN